MSKPDVVRKQSDSHLLRFKTGVITGAIGGAIGTLAGPHVLRWLGRRAMQRLQAARFSLPGSLGRRIRGTAKAGAAPPEGANQPAATGDVVSAGVPSSESGTGSRLERAAGTRAGALARATVRAVAAGAQQSGGLGPKLAIGGLALTVAAVGAFALRKHLQKRNSSQGAAAVPEAAQSAPAEKPANAPPQPVPTPATPSSPSTAGLEEQVGAALNLVFQKLGLNLRATAKLD